MKTATRHSVMLVGAFVATSVLNYAFGVMLSWHLGPSQYGVLGVAQSLLLLMGLIVGGGFAWTAARDVALLGMSDEARLYFRAAWLANTGTGLILAGGLWLAFATGGLRLGAAYGPVIPLVALTTFLLAARAAINGAMRGLYRFTQLAVNLVGEVVVKFIAGFALVAAGAGVAGAMLGFALGAAVSLLHSLWIIRSDKFWSGPGWFNRRVIVGTIPLLVGMLGPALMLNLDVLGLKLLAPASQSDELAGFYQAAVILARTPVYIAQAVTMVLFSYAARAQNPTHKNHDAASYIYTALRTWGRLLLPIGLVLALAPNASLALFFPARYQPAATALRVAAIGGVLLALVTMLYGVLQAVGQHRLPVIAAGLAMMVQVIVLIWLVPRQGALGAAWSLLAAGAMGLIGLLPAVRLAPILPSQDSALHGLFHTGLPILILMAALILLPDGGRATAVGKLGLVGASYMVVLSVANIRLAKNSERPIVQFVGQFMQMLMGG